MADSIADGTYMIHCVGNTSLVVDSNGATDGNNANVSLWGANFGDAQYVRVWTRPDGTRQLCFAATGKCIDVENGVFAQGTNVQQYSANNTAAQQWKFVPVDGKTVTMTTGAEGEPTVTDTYQVYKIYCASTYDSSKSDNFLLEAAGVGTPVSGTNLCISHDEGTSTDQMFAFVPTNPIPTGTYCIRPKVNLELVLDVEGSSHSDGARVIISADHRGTGTDYGNNQVVYLSEGDATGRCKIAFTQCDPMKLMELAYAMNEARWGSQVVQSWDEGGSTDQRWVTTPHGHATLNGAVVPCYVVRNFAASGGESLPLDVYCGRTYPGTYLQVWGQNWSSAQDFVFEPATMTAGDMVVASSLGLSTSAKGSVTKAVAAQDANTAVYLRWSGAWKYWKVRYRYRLRRKGGAWLDWGAWRSAADGSIANNGLGTIWKPNVTTDGSGVNAVRVPVMSLIDNKATDMCEFQFEVASFQNDYKGTSGLTACGPLASSTCSVAWRPTLTLSALSWSPDGLALDYTSDYRRGGNTLVISCQLLKGDATITSMPYSGTALIDNAMLVRIPEEGEKVDVKLTMRTDGIAASATANMSCAWDASYGLALSPTYTRTDRDTVLVTVPKHTTSDRCWVTTPDGMEECERVSSTDSTVTFEAIPALNAKFNVFNVSHDGDKWGTAGEALAAFDEHAYVWNWGTDGCLIVRVNVDEPPSRSESLSRSVTSLETTGRVRPVYRAGKSIERKLDMSGVLLDAKPESHSTEADARALIDAFRALFRDPTGLRVRVAVSGIDIPHQKSTHTAISVKQSEESA